MELATEQRTVEWAETLRGDVSKRDVVCAGAADSVERATGGQCRRGSRRRSSHLEDINLV